MAVALVFAGGSGIRMGAEVPKQFLEICGKPVLAWTLELFQRHSKVDGIILVRNEAYAKDTEAICERFGITKIRAFATGGDSAQDSIYNGLQRARELFPFDTTILIHDGVRPYVTSEVIDAVIDSVVACGNGITYTPCYETVVLSHDGKKISAIPPRSESFTAQAPQGFRLGDILAAHDKIRATPQRYEGLVDQATLYWKLGLPINLVPGNRGNIKITTPEDLCTLRALLEWRNCKWCAK